jgi:DNA-binding PadR family transcriptional regulator
LAKTPKAPVVASIGFAGNRAPLGGFSLKMMQAIKTLGDEAYGAAIEAWLEAQQQPVDQGQVYVTGKRLVDRGLVTTDTRPNKKRGGNYTMKVYVMTDAGVQAIADSIVAYDALRLFGGAQKKKGR